MKKKAAKRYRKRRRNPADIIQFPREYYSPEEREAEELERRKITKCIDGMKERMGDHDLLTGEPLVWDEDDQEIAEKQFCPIEVFIDSIQFDLSRRSMHPSRAILGLTESIFRLGRLQGQIAENDVANVRFWREEILDLVRDATNTLLELGQ